MNYEDPPPPQKKGKVFKMKAFAQNRILVFDTEKETKLSVVL